jgi:hypothetical protein
VKAYGSKASKSQGYKTYGSKAKSKAYKTYGSKASKSKKSKSKGYKTYGSKAAKSKGANYVSFLLIVKVKYILTETVPNSGTAITGAS